MEKTTFYLVRHGESLGNAKHVLLGWTDLDLSELGYAQARSTAAAMADIHFDAIYSSSLLRAYNTAVPHAELRAMTVEGRDELREIFLGEWENMSVESVIEKYGEDMYFRQWRDNFGTFTCPGGESVQGACDRFFAEVERIAVCHPGGTVLIAAHGAVIRSFYGRASGIAPEKLGEELPFPSNASYSIVEYSDGKFSPVSFSCDSHLSEIGITKVNW